MCIPFIVLISYVSGCMLMSFVFALSFIIKPRVLKRIIRVSCLVCLVDSEYTINATSGHSHTEDNQTVENVWPVMPESTRLRVRMPNGRTQHTKL